MSEKIINTFQQRRQIQSRLSALAETKSEAEMLQAVRTIANEFSEELLLAPYLKLLDTTNSQLRGGLAHLATLLSPEEIIPVLRSAVANRNNTTQVRLNAVTILERFLGEEVSPALLSDLENTDEIAFQSLCEAVEEGKQDRHIFLEYVLQMKEESIEVAFIVIEQLERLPAGDQLEMLRILAQEDREPVALAALNRLAQLSPADAGERLLQVLHTLQLTLPPQRARHAERALRKLRFSGVTYKPPQKDGWRALLAPAEASGNQTIWFFQSNPRGEDCPFISITINTVTGILQTYGTDRMSLEDLPSAKSIGELMTVALDGGDSLIFLEAPFDYGRWLVKRALEAHCAGDEWQPLFGEYSLYNDLLWQFQAPELDADLRPYFQDDAAAESTEDPALMDLENLRTIAIELLQHPAMGGWIAHSHLMWNAIQNGFSTDDAASLDEFATLVIREIFRWPEHDQFVRGIAAGLQIQAVWLHVAGMKKSAKQAHLLARSFRSGLVKENPFVHCYIRGAIEGKVS